MLNLEKVRRDTARRLFESGERIYLLPCKVRLGNPWINPMRASKNEDTNSFDNIVSLYEYWNCGSELGKRVSFYKEV